MDSVRSTELRAGTPRAPLTPDLVREDAASLPPPEAEPDIDELSEVRQTRQPSPALWPPPRPVEPRALDPREPEPPPATAPDRRKRTARRARLRKIALLGAMALVSAASMAFITREVVERWFSPNGTVETSLGHQQHWQTDEIVVTIDDSLGALDQDHEKAIRAAFDEWTRSGATLPHITFRHGKGRRPSLTPDGVNSILVAPITFEGHEMDLAITVGFSSPKTGEITEADIVINSRHRFANLEGVTGAMKGGVEPVSAQNERPKSCVGSFDGNACGQSYDLQNVLTHEVGHFWGLGEDYEDPRATMFSCTSACEVHKRVLTEGDSRLVSDLYAKVAPSGWMAQFVGNAKSPWLIAPFAALLVLGAFAVRRSNRRSRATR